MGLSVGDKILLWIAVPIIAGLAVVFAPEIIGTAVEVELVRAEKKSEAQG